MKNVEKRVYCIQCYKLKPEGEPQLWNCDECLLGIKESWVKDMT